MSKHAFRRTVLVLELSVRSDRAGLGEHFSNVIAGDFAKWSKLSC